MKYGWLIMILLLWPAASYAKTETCQDGEKLPLSDMLLSNNTWGRKDIKNGQQCVSSSPLQWHWDWSKDASSNACDHVVSYPSLVYGQRPWSKESRTSVLPKQISAIENMTIETATQTQADGVYNTALDIWVTHNKTPSQEAITTEIMIWMNYVKPPSASIKKDEAIIDGIGYEIWVGRMKTWRYIALVMKTPVDSAKLSLGHILDHLAKRQYINPSDWVAAIEFGNEVKCGSGKTLVKTFKITP